MLLFPAARASRLALASRGSRSPLGSHNHAPSARRLASQVRSDTCESRPPHPRFAVASREGSFIRPRLVSLGLSLNRALVGIAGGGLVVCALLARVCGRCPLAGGALWSAGARVACLVLTLESVLSECSGASETPPDAEEPVHTRELMVHGSRGTMTGLLRGLGFTGRDGGSRQHLAKTTAHGQPDPERCPPPRVSEQSRRTIANIALTLAEHRFTNMATLVPAGAPLVVTSPNTPPHED